MDHIAQKALCASCVSVTKTTLQKSVRVHVYGDSTQWSHFSIKAVIKQKDR